MFCLPTAQRNAQRIFCLHVSSRKKPRCDSSMSSGRVTAKSEEKITQMPSPRFELGTFCLLGRRSIQLSHEGFEISPPIYIYILYAHTPPGYQNCPDVTPTRSVFPRSFRCTKGSRRLWPSPHRRTSTHSNSSCRISPHISRTLNTMFTVSLFAIARPVPRLAFQTTTRALSTSPRRLDLNKDALAKGHRAAKIAHNEDIKQRGGHDNDQGVEAGMSTASVADWDQIALSNFCSTVTAKKGETGQLYR